MRCFDPAAEAAMIAEVEAAAKAGDTLGGVVEVLGYGVPPGLGATCTGTARSTACSRRRS